MKRTPSTPIHEPAGLPAEDLQFVTVRLDNQLIGLAIENVRDVFQVQTITPVFLAPPSIAGISNLRGRIVLLVDLADRLALPSRPAKGPRMAVGIDWRGETHGLLVDSVGDVLSVPATSGTPVSPSLTESWARYVGRLFQLDREVMIELDLNALLGSPFQQAA